jgi:protein-disulfide isomerase
MYFTLRMDARMHTMPQLSFMPPAIRSAYMIDVLVIGTEPVCPRCDLLREKAQRIADTIPDTCIRVRHCAFDAHEAQTLAQKLHKKIGTAKHVARAAGISMDTDAVYALIERRKKECGPDASAADTWCPQLDAMLQPCQDMAQEAGYLMTPVLVVNGKVVHHGSVPDDDTVRTFMVSR